MKKNKALFLLINFFIFILIHHVLAAEEINKKSQSELIKKYDLKKILTSTDDFYRGKTSISECSMSLKTKYYERTLKFKVWSKGMENTLIRILEPAKDKGISTLKRDKNIWNYLPKVKKTVKLPPSMMMKDWMGSHFTNDDLVKESTFFDDYTSSIKEVKIDEKKRTIVVIESIPKKTAAVVWGKVVIEIWDDDGKYIPLKQEYYDEHGKAIRRITFSDIKKMGGRDMPTVMKLVPLDKPDEYTQMTYTHFEFDVPIDDNVFSLGYLEGK